MIPDDDFSNPWTARVVLTDGVERWAIPGNDGRTVTVLGHHKVPEGATIRVDGAPRRVQLVVRQLNGRTRFELEPEVASEAGTGATKPVAAPADAG